jgi:hypothetical protein
MLTREITLEAGGTTYILAPSLQCLRAVARRWPKMQDAIDELRGLSFEACATIVAAATGLTPERAEKVVFEAGIARSTAPCVELLAYLINPDGDEVADEGKPANP